MRKNVVEMAAADVGFVCNKNSCCRDQTTGARSDRRRRKNRKNCTVKGKEMNAGDRAVVGLHGRGGRGKREEERERNGPQKEQRAEMLAYIIKNIIKLAVGYCTCKRKKFANHAVTEEHSPGGSSQNLIAPAARSDRRSL